MSLRPYTGTTEGVGRGRRPGTEFFADGVEYLTMFGLWNNGTYGVRPVRGGTALSVHSTGRAVDLSARPMGDQRKGSDRETLATWAELLVKHADALGVEYVMDYSFPGGNGGGRGWKCSRGTWRYFNPGEIDGGGQRWADWLHVELSPAAADDVAVIQKGFTALLGADRPKAVPSAPKYPGRPLKLGSRGMSVEAIQTRLKLKVDGWFGPVTDGEVRAYQRRHGLTVDGIVGPITWASLFPK